MRTASHVCALFAAGLLAFLLAGCGGGTAGGGDEIFAHDFGNGFSTRGRGGAIYSIPGTGQAVFMAGAGGDIDYLAYAPLGNLFRDCEIAFTSNRAGNDDIYVMNSDGSNVRHVTTDAGQDRNPSISSDGSHIFFDTTRHGYPQVYVINADGTGETRLTTSAASDYQPAVSPDGKYVAFTTSRNGGTDVYLMEADGTGAKRLTYHSGIDEQPDISPDNLRICFVSDRSADAKKHIWVMNIDGASPVQVTQGSGSETDCRWSPDGQRIVYVNENGWVYTMKRDGTDVQAVATGNPPVRSSPDFSPDGQKVVFSADLSGNRELFVVSADGTGVPVRLTYDDAQDRQPSLSGSRLGNRVFVGPTGSDRGRDPAFGSVVAGFIASLAGAEIGDVIGIDASVRADLYIDALYLGSEAGLVGATISGSVITLLLQDNGWEIAPTKIIGTGGIYEPSTDTVEVFFHPDTGRLVSVVPIGRGVSRGGGDEDVFENGRYLVRGEILAAIDVASGRNLAPDGASEVSIDPATGQIMAVR
jgi:hypothetical protein